jgi:hypothetical protein
MAPASKRREVKPTGWCFCGCGTKVPLTRFFVSSHDRKAEARIIREQYGSVAAFVAAHDPNAGKS